MKLWVKIAAAVGGLLVVALVALALAVPRIVKSDAVRERAEAAAYDALGREVRYGGLDVGLLPPSLLVEEGQSVRRGQVLARFDNQPQIKADLAEVDARLRTLSAEISMQTRAVQRYATAAQVGAAALVVLDDERDELMRRQGERREAVARRRGLLADLADSELRSPINGLVLRVNAREGERPGAEGVIEVGATQAMEALIEVYESDVGRIGVGQTVTLVSENGGLDGSLSGEVIAISPQVRQRAVLSTDPTGDADARIVEVRVKLDAASASRVQALSGMKVIARFKPL